MKWSLIYLLAMVVFWQQTDIVAGGTFAGVVAPLGGFLSFVAFLFSLLAWFTRRNRGAGGEHVGYIPSVWGSSDSSSSGSDCGGDGGGGDGGC